MVARIQRESFGWKSSWAQRLTRKNFSWTIFRTYEKCGFGWAQHLYSLPERPKLWDLPEDQSNKGSVQKTYWLNRTSCRKFWWFWLQPITKFSVKDVNLETIIERQSWCKTWLPNGSSSYPCKTKLHKKPREACKSSWSPLGSLMSFTLTCFLEFSKACEDLSLESLYVDTTQIRNTWDCWERCAQSERRYICCILAIRSGWEMVGRFHGMLFLSAKLAKSLVWWEDSTRKTFLGNHLKDRLFHLVHWLSITLSKRRTSQEFINLERKSYLDCSLDTLCTRVEFGRVTWWLQTLRSWKRWTHWKSAQKDSMQRK